jgi:hypothetical protein
MSAPDLLLDATGIPVMTRSSHEAVDCEYRLLALYPLDPAKRVQDESDYSRRGTAYHAIKKHYVRLLAAANTPMDHDLAKEAFRLGVAEARPMPRILAEVQEIWDRHSQHFELNLDAYHSTEVRIERLEHDPPYTIESDLSYAHGERDEFETIDDKTFFRALTEAQTRALYQTRYYTWAQMIENPGYATYRFTLNFVRLNQFTSVVFTADDFDELDELVRAEEARRRSAYQRFRGGETPQAVAGDVCAFCHLACPIYANPALGLTRINSPETFSTVGQSLIVQEKQRRAMLQALKAYVTVNGQQNVHGEVFRFKASLRRWWSTPVVVDTARAMGLTVDWGTSFSALKKIFKAHPPLEAKLQGVMQSSTGAARFGHASERAVLKEAEEEDDDE